jgi:cell division protein FtsX
MLAEIFLEVDASDDEIAGVRAAVEQSSAVKRFAYSDKDTALATFQRLFRGDPDLLAKVIADVLPVSFIVRLRPDAKQPKFARTFERIQGVESVVVPSGRGSRAVESICNALDAARMRGFNDLEVFMMIDPDPGAVDAVRVILEASPLVERFDHLDKEDALKEFKRIFRADADITMNIDAADLPESFRVWVGSSVDPAPLVETLTAAPSVEHVVPSPVLPPGAAYACDAGAREPE